MYKKYSVKVYYPTKEEIRYRRTVRLGYKVVRLVVVLFVGFVVGVVLDILW